MAKQDQSAARKPQGVGKHIGSFAVMIILTSIAFYLVGNEILSIQLLIPVIIGLATIQVILQLFIFMHLDQKGSTFPIIFMAAGILIAVVSAVGIILM